MYPVDVSETPAPRPRPSEDALGFGRHFTDHLLRADFTREEGFVGARVLPYGELSLDPATAALHYGQSVFEGLKAFPRPGRGMSLFRPFDHAKRFAESARRLAMPPVDPDLLVAGFRELLTADAGWMPSAPGTALYLRPLLFASEPFLGVRAARAYTLLVFLSPVGGYFGTDRPLRLWVERNRARAVAGGIGAAKASANYVAGLLSAEEAKSRGFDEVLWLDAATHRFLEEIGTMNVFVRLGDTLVTPPLKGTILAGVTRDSVMVLARERGVKVEERPISIEEIISAHRSGVLSEVFGTGTAALVAPVGELVLEGTRLSLPPTRGLGALLREELSAIQRGERPDRYGWLWAV